MQKNLLILRTNIGIGNQKGWFLRMDFSALVPYWRQWWDWKRAQSQEWENLVVSRHLLALPSLSVKMGTNDSCPVDLTGHLSNSSETISMKAVGKLYAVAAKSLLSCPTLCDPREDSPPGCPFPGILQARTLKISSLSYSIVFLYFFALITEEGFLISPCYSLELCI